MRNLNLMVLLFLVFKLSAQVSELDSSSHYESQFEDNYAEPSFVQHQSVVEFENSFSVLFKIENKYDNKLYVYQEENETEPIEIVSSEEGLYIIDDLPKNNLYLFKVKNFLGQLVNLHTLLLENGYNYKNSAAIPVSAEMWNLLEEFQYQEESPKSVLKFLTDEGNTIHWYEKLAYLQSAKLYGEAIEDKYRERLDLSDFELPAMMTACECEVITLSDFVYGATTNPDSWWPEYVSNHVDPYEHKNVASSAWYYKRWLNKGAAKEQFIHSSGHRNNPCEVDVGGQLGGGEEWFDGAYTSPPQNHRFGNRSEIKVRLICNNGEELPAECECNRKVDFQYDYQSYNAVHANVRSAGFLERCKGYRNAVASVQDKAVVFCSETRTHKGGEDTLSAMQIIDVMSHTSVAHCRTEIDSQFFQNWSEFLDTLFIFIGDGLEGVEIEEGNVLGNIGSIVENFSPGGLFRALGKIIGQGYFREYSCTNYQSDVATMGPNSSFQAMLRPNKTLTFGIHSHATTGARGRRSWESKAVNVSAYAMVVHVSPGPSQECCSDNGAIYSGSCYAQPIGGGGLWNLMGSLLHVHAMDDCYYWSGGSPYSKGYFGSCTRPSTYEECNVDISGPQIRSDIIPPENFNYDYSLIDLNGRVVFKIENSSESIMQINEMIREKNNIPTGIYLIQKFNKNSNENEIFKVFKP